jgi:Glycosyl transferases group 1
MGFRFLWMRILLSCLQSLKRHRLPAYGFWRNYFVQGLIEEGHEVVEVPNVDWAEGLTYPAGSALDSWRSRTWETLKMFVQRELTQRPIHLFLGYFYPRQVEATAIRELQQNGIPCVNFFCDNVREFVKLPAEYRAFALHWVPEFEALPMYRDAGLTYIHAPMPCWVSETLRNSPPRETEPATFLGSADVLRRDLLGRALQGGADFVVRGPGWLGNSNTTNMSQENRSIMRIVSNQIEFVRQKGVRGLLRKIQAHARPLRPPSINESKIGETVFDDDYLRITREAMITIGVNRVPTAFRSPRRPLVYSRLRDIEAPMLGACYLTEWTEGLEHMYELGTEIETYRTPEELTSKLIELRSDPSRRTAMRERARRRALTDHTVGRSIKRIREHLGL